MSQEGKPSAHPGHPILDINWKKQNRSTAKHAIFITTKPARGSGKSAPALSFVESLKLGLKLGESYVCTQQHQIPFSEFPLEIPISLSNKVRTLIGMFRV
jgi:hypothetical protein